MTPSPALYITTIIIAGEAIFSLPFLIQRVFKPTLLDVFEITNLQLGFAFSAYGIIALIAYLLGGPLADRFSPRWLMVGALVTTAVGGFYFATIPTGWALNALFAYWGVTTILTFWAAMIKATKAWGGTRSQGLAFGILDGGRGLCAAALGSLALVVFTALLPEDVANATLIERTEALRQAIYIATGFTFFAAALVWWVIPSELDEEADEAVDLDEESGELEGVARVILVLKNPLIWLQGLILISAYCCFKSVDNLGLFAKDALNFNDVEAASVSELSLWIRPFAAFAIGLLGDRIGATKGITGCFVGLIIGYTIPAFGWVTPSHSWALWLMVVETGVMVFGLRGLYFAILGQTKTPANLIGTAVGVISIIGYLPDIFMGSLMGAFNQSYPGGLGHQYIYITLLGISVMGLGASISFSRLARR